MKTLSNKTQQGTREKGEAKTARIPIKIERIATLPKPKWLHVNVGLNQSKFDDVKQLLDRLKLITVCDEAFCPNRGECYGKGIATFMILGDRCTRRCPFCDVAHGIPLPPDITEPERLAQAVNLLKLSHVVITSVNRDDLPDGGAQHFTACINALRNNSQNTSIEILTPDFRNKKNLALQQLVKTPPDIFNHNLETVPRLYKSARPGANYNISLDLLQSFHLACPNIPIKSGLMVGLGENDDEIIAVMKDLHYNGVSMITIGQYMSPSKYHLPVRRYVTPQTFEKLAMIAKQIGFTSIASGPFVRSSYHADIQAKKAGIS